MSTFALSSADTPEDVIGAINYALANLGNNQTTGNGNVAYTGNIMVANTTSGIISSVNNSGQTQVPVISYLYNYINVKYANSASGGTGFTSNSAYAGYYGLRNSNTTSISSNPTDYTWTQVAGGFGATKGLYYYNIGGNQINFAVANTAPTNTFSLTQPDTPIYLPTVANNAINTPQLVTNSATQALFGAGPQVVQQLAFINGNTNQSNAAGYLWPAYTRGFAIGGGVTIVPQSNGSATGSQIQINYNAYINTQGNSTVTSYNLVELWKNVPSSQFITNFLSMTYASPSAKGAQGYSNTAPITSDKFEATGSNGSSFQLAIDASGQANIIVVAGSSTGVTKNCESLFAGYQTPISSATGYSSGPVIMSTNGFEGGPIQNGQMVGSNLYTNLNPLPIFNINGVLACECFWTVPGSSGTRQKFTYPSILVGPGGRIMTVQTQTEAPASIARPVAYYVNETSGVFSDLNGIAADRTLSATSNKTNPPSANVTLNQNSYTFNSVAVGTSGTILYTQRQYDASGNIIVNTGWTGSDSGTTQTLNAVACNWAANLSATGGDEVPGAGTVGNLWVAVGNGGTIVYAPNAGGPTAWTVANTVPTTQNLYAVSYTQGYWTAVGAAGTIITSTDGNNWYGPIANPAATSGRDLYGCAGGQLTGNTIVGGQGIVLLSTEKTANTWSTVYSAGAAVTSNFTRLAYYGSNANIANVAQPAPQQQIANAQVISNTYTDVNYAKGVTETYFLVIGNTYGNANIYTGGSTMTVTEIKR